MDRALPLVTPALPDGSEPSSQQEHNKRLEALTLPPNSPDPNPTERLWDALEQVRSTDVSAEDAKPSDRARPVRASVGGS